MLFFVLKQFENLMPKPALNELLTEDFEAAQAYIKNLNVNFLNIRNTKRCLKRELKKKICKPFIWKIKSGDLGYQHCILCRQLDY